MKPQNVRRVYNTLGTGATIEYVSRVAQRKILGARTSLDEYLVNQASSEAGIGSTGCMGAMATIAGLGAAVTGVATGKNMLSYAGILTTLIGGAALGADYLSSKLETPPKNRS